MTQIFRNPCFSYLRTKYSTRPQFCTCHETWTGMACEKFWTDRTIRIKIGVKAVLTRFQFGAHKPFVKLACVVGSIKGNPSRPFRRLPRQELMESVQLHQVKRFVVDSVFLSRVKQVNRKKNNSYINLWVFIYMSSLFCYLYAVNALVSYICSAPQELPRLQGSWGQHGTHLGPVGPRWAPCWPHELCYQGICTVHALCFLFWFGLLPVDFSMWLLRWFSSCDVSLL